MDEYKDKINGAVEKYLKIEKLVLSGFKGKVITVIWYIGVTFFFIWVLTLIGRGTHTKPVTDSKTSINSGISNMSDSTLDDKKGSIAGSNVKEKNIQDSDKVVTDKKDTCKIFFDVKCAENLFFNKNNIEIYVDGNKIGFIPHGWEFTSFINLPKGEHEVKLISSSSYTRSIIVDKDATFKCYLTVDFSKLDINDFSFSEGIPENEQLITDIPGTYYGMSGSGLVIFDDYTAEYFYKTDEKVTDGYWYLLDERLNLKFIEPACKFYANISSNNMDRMILVDSSSSKEQVFIKISNENVRLSTAEFTSLISNGEVKAKVSNVISIIDSIGTVDKDSGEKIHEAIALYEELDDASKAKIDNYEILEKAEEKFNSIMKAEIEHAIDSIGEVTLDSQGLITEARRLYDASSDTIQKSVENYEVLEQAEESLLQLRAQNIIELIDDINIKKLTLDDEDKIASIEEEYNRLSDKEKEYVENSNVIEEAKVKIEELKKAEEERKIAEKEKELKNALAKLTKTEDKVSGITYYKPSTYPKYLNNKTHATPYLVVKDGKVRVRMIFDFYGSTWIYWSEVIVAVDDYRYKKDFGYFGVNREVDNSGDVVEYVDIQCGNEEIEMLSLIADSDETIVRFQGENHKKDLTLSSKDKKAIGQVMDAYYLLKENQ